MKYYITTPIYYVTGKPHIGNAYTTIMADIIARWHRLCNDEVFFLTGTDEHGEKIEKAAEKEGLEPKAFVDNIILEYVRIWKKLGISYDKFIRTTDKNHEEAVRKFIQRLYEKGDIYKGEYEGWYCVPDETFITELQLVNGKCPVCGREVKKVSEETYFFRLSKYQDKILELYDKNPLFILPATKSAEIINRVKGGLNDISITRTAIEWGIPFPIDEKHTIYVWIDALINYLSAINWPDDKFKILWPADVHIVGKEIVWFHTVIWPALLFSAELEQPKSVFVHGWWTVEGKKMSKSLGNVVDPIDIVDKYGLDQLRYFFAKEMPFGSDADFSEKALIARINGELVDDLGNLVFRTLTLVERFDGEIKGSPELDKAVNVNKIKQHMDSLDVFNAINEIWSIIRASNKYINEKEVWKLKGDDLANALYNLLESIRIISILISPFMPETSEKIREQLGTEKQNIDNCVFLEWKSKVTKKGHLFEKVKTD